MTRILAEIHDATELNVIAPDANEAMARGQSTALVVESSPTSPTTALDPRAESHCYRHEGDAWLDARAVRRVPIPANEDLADSARTMTRHCA